MKYLLRDRFLLGILLGIVGLIILSVVLFVLRQEQVTYGDESTPEGVVQNYVLALHQRDYQRAYGYLADSPVRPDFPAFQQVFLYEQNMGVAGTAVEIGEVTQVEGSDTAFVSLQLIYNDSGGLLRESYRVTNSARLVRQSGVWRIAFMPDPFFRYNWGEH